MATTLGALTEVSVTSRAATVTSAPATGGATTPYAYQWHRSTTSGFTPSGSNDIEGATETTLNDSGLVPGTVYYYKLVAADSSATPVTATSSQETVTTLADAPSINQFAMAPYLGMTDMKFNFNTLPVQFDPEGSGELVAGMAVKWATGASGVPRVVPCTAAADVAAGFVNYNIKNQVFVAGDLLEISLRGNVMFLMPVESINRGVQLTSLPAAAAGGSNGGVKAVTGSSGLPIVGFALDQLVAGYLGRVYILTPGYDVD